MLSQTGFRLPTALQFGGKLHTSAEANCLKAELKPRLWGRATTGTTWTKMPEGTSSSISVRFTSNWRRNLNIAYLRLTGAVTRDAQGNYCFKGCPVEFKKSTGRIVAGRSSGISA